jgi:flagellar protein FliS
MNSTGLAYRKSAAQSSTGFGLLIALYDTLAGDIRRAAEAERADNIGLRCREINHALLVIGLLEDRCEKDGEGELSPKLIAIYKTLRRKLIQAQVKRSPAMLEEQMNLVLSIREIWQGLEQSAPAAADATTELPAMRMDSDAISIQEERIPASWSA